MSSAIKKAECRAIACVDFCEGFPTAALEKVKLRKVVEDLQAIDNLEVMEINPSNYTHEDVCELNSNAVQTALIVSALLATLTQEEQ